MDSVKDSPIPIVDFAPFINGDVDRQHETAKKIDEAFREVGFVYLLNHGVPKEKVDGCFGWSERFFALPEETKLLAPHPPGGSHHRGYSAPGKEKVTQNVFDDDQVKEARQIPDIKESFESGNVDDEMQPNIWLPEDKLPGFRGFMEDFFGDCKGLIHQVLGALSLALDLPADYLSPTHSRSLFQLRILHYPPVPTKLLKGNVAHRISAHSDFGTLTLLFQDNIGGLEVQSPPRKEGTFRPAPPVEGAVLVNVGDLMERWSNGRWKSTVHRVVAPITPNGVETLKDGQEVCKSRYSIPFFAAPDPDAVIDALPGTWGEGRPKLYEKTTSWGYVQMRMASLYEGSADAKQAES